MAHDFSSIARFGLDSLMGDLIPMEDGQFVRLADVEAVLATQGALPMDEQSRMLRTGQHMFDIARRSGWPDDGEGAFEFLTRLIYARTQPPATQTEDLAGAVWDGPNTASQVDPCMALPSKR